jgi:hypothetical protein
VLNDTRRWSFASVQSNSSSGYTGSGGVNTPPNEKAMLNRQRSSNVPDDEKRNLSAQSSVTDEQRGVTPLPSQHHHQHHPSAGSITMMTGQPSHVMHRLSLRTLN